MVAANLPPVGKSARSPAAGFKMSVAIAYPDDRHRENPIMSDHVYKTVELTGSSEVGVDDAVRNAIARASKSLKQLKWFHITEVRGGIDNGQVAHWQVTLKVGFTLMD